MKKKRNRDNYNLIDIFSLQNYIRNNIILGNNRIIVEIVLKKNINKKKECKNL